MKSKIIVIEGLDGSGKATQTKILCEKISALGKKVTKLEFPNYESPAAAPVKMYLDGEFGDRTLSVIRKFKLCDLFPRAEFFSHKIFFSRSFPLRATLNNNNFAFHIIPFFSLPYF